MEINKIIISIFLVLSFSVHSEDNEIKSRNYQIDTYKKRIYIYGIAETKDELKLVVDEAKSILDVEKVIASILLMEDLRIQKN